MRTIWTFIDEAGGAATNETSHNGVCGQSELPTTGQSIAQPPATQNFGCCADQIVVLNSEL
jgi:hypothetical protein